MKLLQEIMVCEYKNKAKRKLFQNLRVLYLEIVFFWSKFNKFQLPKIASDSVLDTILDTALDIPRHLNSQVFFSNLSLMQVNKYNVWRFQLLIFCLIQKKHTLCKCFKYMLQILLLLEVRECSFNSSVFFQVIDPGTENCSCHYYRVPQSDMKHRFKKTHSRGWYHIIHKKHLLVISSSKMFTLQLPFQLSLSSEDGSK